MKPDKKKKKSSIFFCAQFPPNIPTNAAKTLLFAVLTFVKWFGKLAKSVGFSVKQHMWCDHWLTGHVCAWHILKKTWPDFFQIVYIIDGCEAIILCLILDIFQITLQFFLRRKKCCFWSLSEGSRTTRKSRTKILWTWCPRLHVRRVGSVSWVAHTSSEKAGEGLTKTTMPLQPLSSHPEHRGT